MFWHHKWCSNILLAKFPELFSSANDPVGPVLAYWSDTGWNIEVSYLNQEELIDRREELMQLLPEHLTYTNEDRDRSRWEWEPKRIFQSKCLLQTEQRGTAMSICYSDVEHKCASKS